MNTLWEYKIVSIDTNRLTSTGLPDDLNEKFNNWGAEGWELVKVESILKPGFILSMGSYTKSFVAFFKRPKQ
jgi:hypothetical protein